jgi:hypothetical protein
MGSIGKDSVAGTPRVKLITGWSVILLFSSSGLRLELALTGFHEVLIRKTRNVKRKFSPYVSRFRIPFHHEIHKSRGVKLAVEHNMKQADCQSVFACANGFNPWPF